MPNWKSQIRITTERLEPPPNESANAAGARVDFWGIVRTLENGAEISGIDYEAHRAMAQHQLEMIAAQAREDFGVQEIILQHRIGFVAAGEASLFLRVASGHRAEAFAASQWIVDELKKKVPIWKRPLFVRQRQQRSQIESSRAQSRDPVAQTSR